MTRTSIVQDYKHPNPGSTSTLTIDDRIQQEILKNNIKKPKGYTVSYHANPETEKMHFGSNHPMKPWRLTLTNKIVMAYGMHEAMDIYIPRAATEEELKNFHHADYIDFLQRAVPADQPRPGSIEHHPYNMGDDCPIFDGLYEYCTLYSGASLDAARKLTNNQSDIAINWSGGLHHAKKGLASGFCYTNDIVIAILQLLLYHPRVLYIDIDVHHGDGVEQAFRTTDRVMTLSFHKFGDKEYPFFPGTGALDETGPDSNASPGAHHSLNVPLHNGIEDMDYVELYKAIVGPCVAHYNPTAIVLQCGADSLGGDRLGCFNLNIKAHGACVAFTKTFHRPLLVVGGGGYTARNVAKAWAYETSICIGAEVPPELPAHMPFLEHFGDEKTLFPKLDGRVENRNSKVYLQSVVMAIQEQLRYIESNPSVQMQHIPPDIGGWREDLEREVRAEREQEERERRRRERKG